MPVAFIAGIIFGALLMAVITGIKIKDIFKIGGNNPAPQRIDIYVKREII